MGKHKDLINAVKKDSFDKNKKLLVQPNEKTMKIAVADFITFVSKVYKSTSAQAMNAITNGDVSVNGEIVSVTTYIVKAGDVVRVDIGHYLRNSGYMAVAE